MKHSANREHTARIVFNSITEISNFNVVEFAPHKKEKCFCDCFVFNLVTPIDRSETLEEFLKSKNLQYEKSLIEGCSNFNIELSTNRIRNCFNDLYRKSLPSIKEHGNLYKQNSPRKRVLIYKSFSQENLQYKIIDNDLCKLTKEGTDIIEALLISVHSIVCFVEGTGCRCSRISPIKPSELNPNFLLEIIDRIEAS